jgi:hypothetical protein
MDRLEPDEPFPGAVVDQYRQQQPQAERGEHAAQVRAPERPGLNGKVAARPPENRHAEDRPNHEMKNPAFPKTHVCNLRGFGPHLEQRESAQGQQDGDPQRREQAPG